MADIEKIIKGLEYAWEYIRERPNPTASPKAYAMGSIKKAVDFLKEQPEIVRCKDCKNHDRCEIAYGCKQNPDWFCADGKRRGKIDHDEIRSAVS